MLYCLFLSQLRLSHYFTCYKTKFIKHVTVVSSNLDFFKNLNLERKEGKKEVFTLSSVTGIVTVVTPPLGPNMILITVAIVASLVVTVTSVAKQSDSHPPGNCSSFKQY